MATSPNFSWPEPDNTDLVKNGALAIRTAVDAIDSSMADLKGGTTGQVLTKASGTDMDFTWSTASGGSNQFYAGKNKIINGDFGIWQRGTSFTIATGNGAYTADRFEAINESGANLTTSRQTFTPGTAPVVGYEGEYFCRLATTSATGDTYIVQRIEDVRSFAGQTVTVSFWAKCASGTVSSNGYYLQGFGTGGSSTVFANLGAVTITTSWQRFTQTIAIPSVSGKTIGANSSLSFQVLRYAASNTVDLWGVQVEAGSSATSFQTATGTIQGELAACQRYYYRLTADTAYSQFTNYSPAFSSTAVTVQVPIRVTMRVKPTSVDYSTVTLADGTNFVTASTVAVGTHASASIPLIDIGATGMTATTRSYSLWANNSTSAYLGISAEL